MNVDHPYRAPTTIPELAESPRQKDSLALAATIWLADAALLLLVYVFVRPVFVDFELELPLLSQWLIQPLAAVMCLMIAIGTLVFAVSTKDPSKRRRVGAIALTVGLLAVAAIVFGAISPLLSLISALS